MNEPNVVSLRPSELVAVTGGTTPAYSLDQLRDAAIARCEDARRAPGDTPWECTISRYVSQEAAIQSAMRETSEWLASQGVAPQPAR